MNAYKRKPQEIDMFSKFILCRARTLYYLFCGRDTSKQALFVIDALLAMAED